MLKTKQRKKEEKEKKICEKPASEAASDTGSKAFGTGGLSSLMLTTSESESKMPPLLQSTSLPMVHLNNRTGHCQIRQGTGEWAPTQEVSGLNSLHSIQYVQASLISQLVVLTPHNLVFAKGFLSFLHSFEVVLSLKFDNAKRDDCCWRNYL